ncbi:MAG: hypothetical protein AAF960_03125 [Bacteroidota bacterium]
MVQEAYESAAAQYKSPLKENNLIVFARFVGFAYYHAKKYEEALRYLKLNNSSKLSGFELAYLSAVYFKKGDLLASNQYKTKLEQRLAEGEYHLNWSLAIVHLARNESKLALGYLEASMASNEIGLAWITSLDPIFKPLEGHPNFLAIRAKMNYYELKD